MKELLLLKPSENFISALLPQAWLGDKAAEGCQSRDGLLQMRKWKSGSAASWWLRWAGTWAPVPWVLLFFPELSAPASPSCLGGHDEALITRI